MSTPGTPDPEVLVDLARIIEGAEDVDLSGLISAVAARLVGARRAATRVADEAGAYPPADAGARSDGVALLDGADVEQGSAAAVEHGSSSPDGPAGQRLAGDGIVALASSSISAPLSDADGRPFGRIVSWDFPEGGPTEQAEALLAALARAVSAALARRRLLASLEEAQRQRQAFFGVLSHELRTPITTIYGGTRVLRRSDGRLSGEARRQLLDDVAGEAERLYRLVEDLLVLSRAERDAVVVAAEPILLQHLLARVVDSERQRWPRADMRTTTPPGLPPVMGDSTLVEQVMRNLLSNAIKYGGGGGPIDVSATPDRDWVEVRVVDRGPGLDPGTQDRVFELFYRAPDAPSRAQGAGIGLYVCRTLIEAMGGEIWVRRVALDDGAEKDATEFGFRLRAFDPDAAEPFDDAGSERLHDGREARIDPPYPPPAPDARGPGAAGTARA